MLKNITNTINEIRISIKLWKDACFLKRHGCETWEQYNRKYDSDCDKFAQTPRQYFKGYSRVYAMTDLTHSMYFSDIAYDGYYVINKWLKQNCTGKHRIDILRVVYDSDHSSVGDMYINEIGGRDFYFIAFKDEKDYLLFLLRWA